MATATFPTAYSRIRSQPISTPRARRAWHRCRRTRPGLRNHRGQLRVAERRQRAGAAEEQEREDQRRARAVADDGAVGGDLAGRRRANGPENARADDGANRQHDQVAGPEDALQRMPAVGLVDEEGGNRLPAEELRHRAGFYPASLAGA